jgi:hypothetical protein
MIPASPTPQPIVITSHVGWTSIFVVVALTITSLAGGFVAAVLYLRPVLRAVEEASLNADKAAKEMELAGQEIQKTMLLVEADLPLTMQEVRKTAEEFEVLGKQLNYLLGAVVRPVEPVGRAAQWMERAAGTTTTSISKRLAEDTATLASVRYF